MRSVGREDRRICVCVCTRAYARTYVYVCGYTSRFGIRSACPFFGAGHVVARIMQMAGQESRCQRSISQILLGRG